MDTRGGEKGWKVEEEREACLNSYAPELHTIARWWQHATTAGSMFFEMS